MLPKLPYNSSQMICEPEEFSMPVGHNKWYTERKWGEIWLCHNHLVWNVYVYICVFFHLFISWRLITLQYCSGFCHTLTWINHGFTCIPHPDPPSHLPLYPIPLGLPSAPGPSTCLMHPTWLYFPQNISYLLKWSFFPKLDKINSRKWVIS